MITTDFVVMALVRQEQEFQKVTVCNTSEVHFFTNSEDVEAFLWRELASIDYRWIKHTITEFYTEWWIVADLCPECKLAGEHIFACNN
jgi:hypothetical protein